MCVHECVSVSPVLGLQVCAPPHLAFYIGAGAQTRVLRVSQQARHSTGHFSLASCSYLVDERDLRFNDFPSDRIFRTTCLQGVGSYSVDLASSLPTETNGLRTGLRFHYRGD